MRRIQNEIYLVGLFRNCLGAYPRNEDVDLRRMNPRQGIAISEVLTNTSIPSVP
jgi:hypothetical protein